MPLSYADKGRPMSVCRITGPQNVKNHLADLGFSPQSLVVVKQEIAGNLIVEVKGAEWHWTPEWPGGFMFRRYPHDAE